MNNMIWYTLIDSSYVALQNTGDTKPPRQDMGPRLSRNVSLIVDEIFRPGSWLAASIAASQLA